MADAAAWDARLKSALDALVPPAAAPASTLGGDASGTAADAADAAAALHACGGAGEDDEEVRACGAARSRRGAACAAFWLQRAAFTVHTHAH
jgi:hypothetical protein